MNINNNNINIDEYKYTLEGLDLAHERWDTGLKSKINFNLKDDEAGFWNHRKLGKKLWSGPSDDIHVSIKEPHPIRSASKLQAGVKDDSLVGIKQKTEEKIEPLTVKILQLHKESAYWCPINYQDHPDGEGGYYTLRYNPIYTMPKNIEELDREVYKMHRVVRKDCELFPSVKHSERISDEEYEEYVAKVISSKEALHLEKDRETFPALDRFQPYVPESFLNLTDQFYPEFLEALGISYDRETLTLTLPNRDALVANFNALGETKRWAHLGKLLIEESEGIAGDLQFARKYTTKDGLLSKKEEYTHDFSAHIMGILLWKQLSYWNQILPEIKTWNLGDKDENSAPPKFLRFELMDDVILNEGTVIGKGAEVTYSKKGTFIEMANKESYEIPYGQNIRVKALKDAYFNDVGSTYMISNIAEYGELDHKTGLHFPESKFSWDKNCSSQFQAKISPKGTCYSLFRGTLTLLLGGKSVSLYDKNACGLARIILKSMALRDYGVAQKRWTKEELIFLEKMIGVFTDHNTAKKNPYALKILARSTYAITREEMMEYVNDTERGWGAYISEFLTNTLRIEDPSTFVDTFMDKWETVCADYEKESPSNHLAPMSNNNNLV